MCRYDVLSAEAMATLEGGWRRLVSEIGIRFDLPRAQDRFNPARNIVFGGDHIVFGGLAGAPFVLDGVERRDGTVADLERFVQLGHTRTTLERYERPPLDAGRLAELDEFVVRRRAEMGD